MCKVIKNKIFKTAKFPSIAVVVVTYTLKSKYPNSWNFQEMNWRNDDVINI